jgi:putative transposase
MVAWDFVTVDTMFLRRCYALFFVEIASRKVHLAGVTSKPDASWVAQQARNLVVQWDGFPFRSLIHDRDAKYAAAFDEIFHRGGSNRPHPDEGSQGQRSRRAVRRHAPA